MDLYQWLLALHVTGAFLLMGGGVIAAILNLTALGRERPSEIVTLFGLTRFAVRSITLGMVIALAFGLWLVADVDFVKLGPWPLFNVADSCLTIGAIVLAVRTATATSGNDT